jgi:hypothetical protein
MHTRFRYQGPDFELMNVMKDRRCLREGEGADDQIEIRDLALVRSSVQGRRNGAGRQLKWLTRRFENCESCPY